jgi:hypothetical protein
MAKRPDYRPEPGSPEQAILRLLKPLTQRGHRPDDIFTDWVHCCDAAGQDTERRCRARYGDEGLRAFAQALGALMIGLQERPGRDVLGRLYMAWAYPNPNMGQFFTPEVVATLMARITLLDTPQVLAGRIRDACAASLDAQAALETSSLDLDALANWDAAAVEQFCRDVLPLAAPYIELLTSLEPCCGSGVMILAQIAALPRWVSQVGLIQFTAIDLDPLCVAMCRVQTAVLGIRIAAHCADALTWKPESPLTRATPEPLRSIYARAALAAASGDTATVTAITQAMMAAWGGDRAPIERIVADLMATESTEESQLDCAA